MAIINSITNINQPLYPVNHAEAAPDIQNRKQSAGKQADVPQESSGADEAFIALSKRQEVNSSFHKIAARINAADTAIKTVNEYVEKMKAELETIVKTYPPYPPGSTERVKILRSYSSVRKIIDQLTIPPPEEWTEKIMAGQARFSQAGNQDTNEKAVQIVQEQPVPTATGLNIPDLSDTATDAEVNDAVSKLDAAKRTLELRQADMSKAADSIALSRETAATTGSVSGMANMTDTAAEQKSAEIRQTVGVDASTTFTNTRSLLSQLLL
jgi:hypothetical protein